MRGVNSTRTRLWVPRGLALPLIAVALMALAACAAGPPPADVEVAPATTHQGMLRAVLHTDQGELALLIDPATAPLAVAALRRSFDRGDWNGVPISWVRPHTEIRTGLPRDAMPLPSELNARALGLHQLRIEDAGAAMNAIQFELEPALLRAGAQASPQLHAWIATWREHFDAAFLVGVTRQQINEAIGYRYQEGHATRPVRRGSVALIPDKPGSSTLALTILLRDQPRRDGCWVVIGEVESGLELVQRLSLAPRLHPKSFEPAQPARITRIDVSASHLD